MNARQTGFTLVEVLIALAVLSIALVAFVSTGAQNADYATYIRQRTVAEWVARDRLVEYQIAPDWPDTGTREGDTKMGGSHWHWQAEIQGAQDPNVRRVDVRVYTVDPDTQKPTRDSVVLMSGFVTRHYKPPEDSDGTNTGPDRDNTDGGYDNGGDSA